MNNRFALASLSARSLLALASAATAALHGCADTPVEDDAPVATSADSSELARASEADLSLDAQIASLLLQHPDAVQVDERSIGWDDGKVVLVLPEDGVSITSAPASGAAANEESISPMVYAPVHGCPDGWYCVYEAANFGGRRLQFSDCTRNDLGDYGFRDRTSSWVNNGSRTIQVMDDLNNAIDKVLWTMAPRSSSSYVGDGANDRADYFRCR